MVNYEKCCICGDEFEVGFLINNDYICASQSCCYEWCKIEGIKIYQERIEELNK